MAANRDRPAATDPARARPPLDERGATVIELAMLMPVILATVLLIVQVALWFHAREVAEAAAREGARVARSAPFDSGGWQGRPPVRPPRSSGPSAPGCCATPPPRPPRRSPTSASSP
ncbi:TadE/TadG family type IV pilus assembly protein [Nonomuraea antimicrobica]